MNRIDHWVIQTDTRRGARAQQLRVGQWLLIVLVAAVVVPLLWLFGILTLLGLIGAGVVMLASAQLRRWWRVRRERRNVIDLN